MAIGHRVADDMEGLNGQQEDRDQMISNERNTWRSVDDERQD
jgi:hypothetical protein